MKWFKCLMLSLMLVGCLQPYGHADDQGSNGGTIHNAGDHPIIVHGTQGGVVIYRYLLPGDTTAPNEDWDFATDPWVRNPDGTLIWRKVSGGPPPFGGDSLVYDPHGRTSNPGVPPWDWYGYHKYFTSVTWYENPVTDNPNSNDVPPDYSTFPNTVIPAYDPPGPVQPGDNWYGNTLIATGVVSPYPPTEPTPLVVDINNPQPAPTNPPTGGGGTSCGE